PQVQTNKRLLAVDEQGKRVGKNGRARTRIVLGRLGSGAEFRGDEIDGVGGVVERHGAGAALRLDHFYRGETRGRVFVSYGEGAVTTRRESVAGDGIEAVCINTLADGNGAEHLAGVAVDEGHELVMAANNEDFVRGVDGQAGRGFAGRERPGILDLESLRVELDERTLV